MKRRAPFDKYAYYFESVQCTEHTIDFMESVYYREFLKTPHRLREDFCGTFKLCCDWVECDPKHEAIGVDLDSEPLAYGRKHYLSALNESQRSRVLIQRANVLKVRKPQVDLIAAFNFSYYIFKQRAELLRYFKSCHASLKREGLFVLDAFGGEETQGPVEDKVHYKGFTYYWDQVNFDPITHEAKFYIHFKRRGEKKRYRVFRYDWRLWTVPELRDALLESGFERVDVYWEGTNSKGEGNGRFSRTEHEENCEAWVVYLVARK